LIEKQLVEELYSCQVQYLHQNNLLPASLLSTLDVTLFYSEKPELFILANGSLFMSVSLLEKCFQIGGLSALSFLLFHELAHVIKGDLRVNIGTAQPYGDIRRQLFMLTNQYTGFDALFIDYFTNTRNTLD